MKKTIIPFLIILTLLLTNFKSEAQSKLKIGYIDSNELLMLMPERDSLKVVFEEYVKTLQNQFAVMSNEFDTKYNDYITNEAKFSELIKRTKTEELKDLKKRIDDYQLNAQTDLENMEDELFSPIVLKATKAIEDVAKENAFTYVIDVSSRALLYYESGENILPLVKKKLGL